MGVTRTGIMVRFEDVTLLHLIIICCERFRYERQCGFLLSYGMGGGVHSTMLSIL